LSGEDKGRSHSWIENPKIDHKMQKAVKRKNLEDVLKSLYFLEYLKINKHF
jgi:hypothetical protein